MEPITYANGYGAWARHGHGVAETINASTSTRRAIRHLRTLKFTMRSSYWDETDTWYELSGAG